MALGVELVAAHGHINGEGHDHANNRAGPSIPGVPNGTYEDSVTGDTRVVSGGTLTVPAPRKGNLRVYVLDLGGENAAPGKIGAAGPYPKQRTRPPVTTHRTVRSRYFSQVRRVVSALRRSWRR